MRLELNELDYFFALNYVIAVIVFVIGLLWDYVAWKFEFRFSPGYDWMQVFLMAFAVLWIFVTWFYARHYGK